MKLINYLSERKFPSLAAKLAWSWYDPDRHNDLCKEYGTEHDLVKDAIITLKRSLLPGSAPLRMKDDYGSMRDFFQDAIQNVVLFGSGTNLFALNPEETIYHGIILMADNNIRRVPLVTPGGALVGIFTVRDIVRLLGRHEKYEALYQAEDNNLDLVLAKAVKQIANFRPITLTEAHSVLDAIRTMVSNHIGGVPIVRGEKLVGIITERDILYIAPLLKDLFGKTLPVMPQKNVVSIEADTKISDAIAIMAGKDFRRLPVVDRGKVVGIITTTDIIQAHYSLSSLFSEALNRPVRDIMIKNTYYVTPRESVDDAIRLMCRRNIGSLLVMEGETLSGIITERDILKYICQLAVL